MFNEAEILRVYERVWNPDDYKLLALKTNEHTLHLQDPVAFNNTQDPASWYGHVRYRWEDEDDFHYYYYLGSNKTISRPDSIALAEAMEQSLVLLRTHPLRYHC